MNSIKTLQRIPKTIQFAIKSGVISSEDWVQRLLLSQAHAESILASLLMRFEWDVQKAGQVELENAAELLSELFNQSIPIIKMGVNSSMESIRILSNLLSQELKKYSSTLIPALEANDIPIPRNICIRAQSPQTESKITTVAQKAKETRTDDLDVNLYPLLEMVIDGLKNGYPTFAVRSSNGASYIFKGSTTLFAYLCLKLKEIAHLESIPWDYILRHIHPTEYKLQTLKTKASQYSSGSCKLPRGYEQINIIVKNAK